MRAPSYGASVSSAGSSGGSSLTCPPLDHSGPSMNKPAMTFIVVEPAGASCNLSPACSTINPMLGGPGDNKWPLVCPARCKSADGGGGDAKLLIVSAAAAAVAIIIRRRRLARITNLSLLCRLAGRPTVTSPESGMAGRWLMISYCAGRPSHDCLRNCCRRAPANSNRVLSLPLSLSPRPPTCFTKAPPLQEAKLARDIEAPVEWPKSRL